MTRTRYEPVGHNEAIAELWVAADRIQATLDGLDAAVAGLRAEWSGDARDAYDKAHREWTAAMVRLRDDLAGIADGGHAAGRRLGRAEADVVALWS